ncbi:hypothetical protein COBT_002557, partial [Conglomerata obtusa]
MVITNAPRTEYTSSFINTNTKTQDNVIKNSKKTNYELEAITLQNLDTYTMNTYNNSCCNDGEYGDKMKSFNIINYSENIGETCNKQTSNLYLDATTNTLLANNNYNTLTHNQYLDTETIAKQNMSWQGDETYNEKYLNSYNSTHFQQNEDTLSKNGNIIEQYDNPNHYMQDNGIDHNNIEYMPIYNYHQELDNKNYNDMQTLYTDCDETIRNILNELLRKQYIQSENSLFKNTSNHNIIYSNSVINPQTNENDSSNSIYHDNNIPNTSYNNLKTFYVHDINQMDHSNIYNNNITDQNIFYNSNEQENSTCAETDRIINTNINMPEINLPTEILATNDSSILNEYQNISTAIQQNSENMFNCNEIYGNINMNQIYYDNECYQKNDSLNNHENVLCQCHAKSKILQNNICDEHNNCIFNSNIKFINQSHSKSTNLQHEAENAYNENNFNENITTINSTIPNISSYNNNQLNSKNHADIAFEDFFRDSNKNDEFNGLISKTNNLQTISCFQNASNIEMSKNYEKMENHLYKNSNGSYKTNKIIIQNVEILPNFRANTVLSSADDKMFNKNDNDTFDIADIEKYNKYIRKQDLNQQKTINVKSRNIKHSKLLKTQKRLKNHPALIKYNIASFPKYAVKNNRNSLSSDIKITTRKKIFQFKLRRYLKTLEITENETINKQNKIFEYAYFVNFVAASRERNIITTALNLKILTLVLTPKKCIIIKYSEKTSDFHSYNAIPYKKIKKLFYFQEECFNSLHSILFKNNKHITIEEEPFLCKHYGKLEMKILRKYTAKINLDNYNNNIKNLVKNKMVNSLIIQQLEHFDVYFENIGLNILLYENKIKDAFIYKFNAEDFKEKILIFCFKFPTNIKIETLNLFININLIDTFEIKKSIKIFIKKLKLYFKTNEKFLDWLVIIAGKIIPLIKNLNFTYESILRVINEEKVVVNIIFDPKFKLEIFLKLFFNDLDLTHPINNYLYELQYFKIFVMYEAKINVNAIKEFELQTYICILYIFEFICKVLVKPKLSDLFKQNNLKPIELLRSETRTIFLTLRLEILRIFAHIIIVYVQIDCFYFFIEKYITEKIYLSFYKQNSYISTLVENINIYGKA